MWKKKIKLTSLYKETSEVHQGKNKFVVRKRKLGSREQE